MSQAIFQLPARPAQQLRKRFNKIIRFICSFSMLVLMQSARAQDTLSTESQAYKSLVSQPRKTDSANKKRVFIIGTANVVGYSAFTIGLYKAWYQNYNQTKFHVFDDFAEWKQMDKLGHVFGAYAAGRESMELWRWTGIEKRKRIWFGGLSGVLYQSVVETLDGFSEKWGWSWTDMAANLSGSALLIAQEFAWDDQRVQMKWSFHRKSYRDAELTQRSNKIFGTATAERFLKDYNGQTYWLSAGLNSFWRTSKIPAWIQISVGTGVEGIFGARENIGRNNDGIIDFSRPEIKRYRQWFLAPDIDLTKIRTNKKGLRFALRLLNILKFPTPSVEFSNRKLKLNWIHF